MPTGTINGVRLFWEQRGDHGPPLVLVHGSWGDHHNWDAVMPSLTRSFRVFVYDRRGHSQSERVSSQGSIEQDVADLAAFIAANNLAPAHIAGNSFGAVITLNVIAAQPELVASATVHEPPLIALIQDHPMMPAIRARLAAVIATLTSGDLETGARQFVENIALGPGMWDQLPPEMRQTFVFNAPTWLDEMHEPETAMTVDLARLSQFTRPLLITGGDKSPPLFPAILEKIAAGVPRVEQYTFRGAGHGPHLTHADEYVRIVTDFVHHGRLTTV